MVHLSVDRYPTVTSRLTVLLFGLFASASLGACRLSRRAPVLDPLASTYVVVDEDDIRGGVGTNVLVHWHAEEPGAPPVVETVMITTASTLGISFRSIARVLYEDRVPAAAADSGATTARP